MSKIENENSNDFVKENLAQNEKVEIKNSDEKNNSENPIIDKLGFNKSKLDSYISELSTFKNSSYENNEDEIENLTDNNLSEENSQETDNENQFGLSQISEDEYKLAEDELEKKPLSKRFFIGKNVYTFLFVFCFAFISFIYTFNIMLTPIKVVGISMQPTINSATYYTGNEDETHCDIVYYRKSKSYKNDDILIIQNDGYVDDNDVKFLIKRLIALPNQTIKFEIEETESNFEDTKYYYSISVYDENNQKVTIDESYLSESNKAYTSKYLVFAYKDIYPCYYEIFSNLIENGEYSYTIPSGYYFVVGDNRNHSTDSRFFGIVEYNDIEGSMRILVAYNQSFLKAIYIKIKSYI